ncbi:MAG TPA: ionic transporter y4hA [Burkholderiales bacterium]|nr:ionic transporter y4hA [Burkholderiales bacterium]
MSNQSVLADMSHPVRFLLVLVWLLLVILLSAFGVVRHAEVVARRLGEPFGTLILTLAVTSIEVMIIIAAMSGSKLGPTLARDSMFAVVMTVLNGMVGLCLLVGGLRHREQAFNLQGAQAFLSVIAPLAVITLVLPNFTQSSAGPTFSTPQAIFFVIVSLALYGVFLAMQTSLHQSFFWSPNPEEIDRSKPATVRGAAWVHGVLLVAYIIPVVSISRGLSVPINFMIASGGAPPALAGFILALLVLSPESWAGFRAAISNDLQRAVNVLMGSALATIALTTPSILVYGLIHGDRITLGLEPTGITLLAITLVLSILTFSSVRTNVLLGAVHLVLFFSYLMLMFYA